MPTCCGLVWGLVVGTCESAVHRADPEAAISKQGIEHSRSTRNTCIIQNPLRGHSILPSAKCTWKIKEESARSTGSANLSLANFLGCFPPASLQILRPCVSGSLRFGITTLLILFSPIDAQLHSVTSFVFVQEVSSLLDSQY